MFVEIFDSKVFAALVGVFTGFLLSYVPRNQDRKNKLKGCKASLRAEIKYAGETACGFLKGKVDAPLYRIPIVAWKNAYPVLLAAGIFAEEQVEALHKYYNAIETFNRGLDQIEAARGDDKKFSEEKNRNPMKAEAVSTCSDLYKAALKALEGVK